MSHVSLLPTLRHARCAWHFRLLWGSELRYYACEANTNSQDIKENCYLIFLDCMRNKFIKIILSFSYATFNFFWVGVGDGRGWYLLS